MTVPGSVSQLIAQARDGDEAAFATLHSRYWPRIVAMAGSRLRQPAPVTDPEDVAQQSFIDLFMAFRRRRLPDLENREQLLALLSHIVVCKALNDVRHHLAQRRGGGRDRTVAPLETLVNDDVHGPLQEAILQDCYSYYMSGLTDALRPCAELHLAGLSNREIAEQLDCVERTVERKLSLLRMHWRAMARASLEGDVDSLLSGSRAPETNPSSRFS